MPEHSLDQFPAWIQTVSYIGALLIGLTVASHGYFKAWMKKLSPTKADVTGGTVVSSVLVIDRAVVQVLTDSLNRTDSTLRSCQDDIRRSQDHMDRMVEIGESIVELLEKLNGRLTG